MGAEVGTEMGTVLVPDVELDTEPEQQSRFG